MRKNPMCALIDMASRMYGEGHIKSAEDFAKRLSEAKGVKINPEAAQEVWDRGIKNHAEGRTMAEERLREQRRAAAKEVSKLQVSTSYEWFMGLVRTGLLSPIRTPQASLFGNAITIASDYTTRMPASLIARVVHKDRRVILPPHIGKSLKTGAISQGAKESLDVILHGASRTDVARYDMNKIVAPEGSHILEGVAFLINKQMDIISASDKPGRMLAWKEAFAEAAALQAMNEFIAEGKSTKGPDLEARILEILGNAASEMTPEAAIDVLAGISDKTELESYGELITHANREEAIMILANPNIPASMLSHAKRMLRENTGEWSQILVDLPAPFVKIPTNAILRSAEYSGLPGVVFGGGKMIMAKSYYNKASKALNDHTLTETQRKKMAEQYTKKADQFLRQGSMTTARGLVGGGALFIVGWMFHELFSEPRDSDPHRRAVQYAAGEGQGGIKTPWGTYSFADFPQWLPFIAGAQARRIWEDQEVKNIKTFRDSYVNANTEVGLGQTLDMPTMRGASEAWDRLDRLKRNKDWGKFWQDTAKDYSGWLTPSWMTDIGRAQDDRRMRMSDTVTDRLRAETPGEMKNMPIRYDAFGREAERGSIPIRNWDPPVSGEDDPVVQEVHRMGVKMSVAYKPPKADWEPAEGYNIHHISQYQRLVGQLRWEAIKYAIEWPEYRSMTRAEKIVTLEDAIKEGRSLATEYWKGGVPFVSEEEIGRR